MNRLLTSRAAILGALRAGGLAVSTTAVFTAPGILVEPGDPWATTERSLGPVRLGRWKLTAVAGRSDSEGALEALADLVDKTDEALRALPGIQLPSWAVPLDVQLAGVPYAASTATVQYQTQPEEVLP